MHGHNSGCNTSCEVHIYKIQVSNCSVKLCYFSSIYIQYVIFAISIVKQSDKKNYAK